MCESGTLVVHVTDWGPPEVAKYVYLISVDVRTRSSTGKLLTLEVPLLRHAGEFLQAFVAAAMTSGYEVWADVSRSVQNGGTWPRWASTGEQIPALFQAVEADSGAIYPVSVWLIPVDRGDSIGHLEAFRAQPFDEELYAEILRLGVVRVSLEETYCDVSSHVDLRPRVLMWMNTASEGQPLPVRWLTIAE